MSENYVGQIIAVGFSFPIQGYSLCDGQTLAISSNTTLFSLLGTIYGGNGQTTFRLPDLRGRMPVHKGPRPGGANYVIGQQSGQETATLSTAQMPPHTHSAQVTGPLTVSTANATVVPAANTYLGGQAGPSKFYTTDDDTTIGVKGLENATVSVGTNGGGQPFPTMSPYLAINFQIAMQGIYPSRS